MNKNQIPLILLFLLLAHSPYAMAAASPSSPTPAAPLLSSPPPSPIITTTILLSPSPTVLEPSPTVSPDNTSRIQESEKAKPEEKGARHSYSSIHVSGPYIAMTFDDGPNLSLTPKLLDMLKTRGIKATFFLIGENAARYPDIVKRMVNEGHEVANHSWSHPALNKCSPEKFQHELNATNEVIQAATGSRPTLIRPPYGATNSNLDRTMDEKYGLKVILWSVDPLDWKYRNSERVANYILTHTKPGDIILAHDIHATTVDAMPKVFDALLAKGLKFLTVSELIAHKTEPTPTPQTTASPQVNPLETPAAPSPSTAPSPLSRNQPLSCSITDVTHF